jgi:hypothetical protein
MESLHMNKHLNHGGEKEKKVKDRAVRGTTFYRQEARL